MVDHIVDVLHGRLPRIFQGRACQICHLEPAVSGVDRDLRLGQQQRGLPPLPGEGYVLEEVDGSCCCFEGVQLHFQGQLFVGVPHQLTGMGCGYPAIAKEAKRTGATVYFADEAGIRSDHHAGTTWAAKGSTPVVKTSGARFSLNMVSAVTAQGLLRFSTFTGSMAAERFIDFCKRLMADTEGPVFLIVDGHPVHRAKKVKKFAANSDGQLRLFFLPGYSPQLNPDEWVWQNIKNDRVGRQPITGPDQMKRLATAGLRRLQALPELVRGFFRDPDLAYIQAAQ